MSGKDDDLEVYIYQGKDGEEVPEGVEKLIIAQGIQVVTAALYRDRNALRQVTFPNGQCQNLLEVSICHTVRHIGRQAFAKCTRLRKVEFEGTTSSPHQLQTIDEGAFRFCSSLPRIKLPSSVTSVSQWAFHFCASLVEANLSTTGLIEISEGAFASCGSLQTVCLPNTLERICFYAFQSCRELVTVVVPLGSQPIRILYLSFSGCRQLANLVLPGDSAAEGDSFNECDLLHSRYGEDESLIVDGLKGRFGNHPVHRICYDQSSITVQELRQCIVDQQERDSLVDEFGMTPFHVFFSTIEPSEELLDVLLNSLPNQILKWKDANDRRPLDYLIANWNDGNSTLLQRTLQKWMIDPLARWGAISWKEEIQSKVRVILAENDERSRATLCDKLYSAFEHYENVEVTSILEMALWKRKLKSGWTSDGSKRQALDRDECRCLSGSDVVIPCVYGILSFG